jgi:Sigma-70 region 2
MDGPHPDADAATFTAGHDGARDDAGLLRRIGQGDEDAMAAFYREHGRVVLAQVLLVTGERVLAEEIVQDTMLAVWRGAGSFRGESSRAAAIVTVGPPISAVNPPGFVPVQRTVSDASTAGFTLVTSSRTRVRVTTSGGTLVVIPHASRGQLQYGATIFALGHAGPDRTLSGKSGGSGLATPVRGAHRRTGKGLLAQRDRRGARRDQRGRGGHDVPSWLLRGPR